MTYVFQYTNNTKTKSLIWTCLGLLTITFAILMMRFFHPWKIEQPVHYKNQQTTLLMRTCAKMGRVLKETRFEKDWRVKPVGQRFNIMEIACDKGCSIDDVRGMENLIRQTFSNDANIIVNIIMVADLDSRQVFLNRPDVKTGVTVVVATNALARSLEWLATGTDGRSVNSSSSPTNSPSIQP